MRAHYFVVVSLVAGLLGAALQVTPVAAAGTCFGRAATVQPAGGVYYLTAGDDVVVGTSGPDYVTSENGEGGTDYICTGAGNDQIYEFQTPSVTIDTGTGNDSAIVQNFYFQGWAEVTLGGGDDFINIFNFAGRLRGGSGDDVLFFQGIDIIPGAIVDAGSGNDYIQSASADEAYGGAGSDTVIDQSDTGATLVDCGQNTDIFYAPNATTVKRCEQDYF